MNNKTLLIIGGILLVIGLVKPNFNLPFDNPQPVNNIVIVSPPADSELKSKCELVINALRNGSSDRKQDGKRLSELCTDLAVLVGLDEENEVIKTTEEIRQANSLSGLMLRINLKNKYDGLSEAAQSVLVSQIGDDIVPLDQSLRNKAVDAFMGLAWAFNEGSK